MMSFTGGFDDAEDALATLPPRIRFEVECRAAYCAQLNHLLARNVKVAVARRVAARAVFRRNAASWFARAAQLNATYRKSKPSERAADRFMDPPAVVVKQPSEFTVAAWHRTWVRSGRRNEVLVPRYHDRGNRTHRKPCRLHAQQSADTPLCIYGAMRLIGRRCWSEGPRTSRSSAYRQLLTLVYQLGLEPISYGGFCAFLDRHFGNPREHDVRWRQRRFRLGLDVRVKH